MATNNNRQAHANTSNDISIATYGVNKKLDDESSLLGDIVTQTVIDVQKKFNHRTGDNIIDEFTRMNLSSIFASGSDKPQQKNNTNDIDNFKELMENNSQSAYSLLSAEASRVLNYENYKAIVDNIPEMALARDTYISNILSPDDYNKAIFNVFYSGNSTVKKNEEKIISDIKKIIKKYKIEDKTEEIISDALTYGDAYMAVLPYSTEIAKLLNSTNSDSILNESFDSNNFELLDEAFHLTIDSAHNETLNESDIKTLLNESEIGLLDEMTNSKNGVKNLVEVIEENIKVTSTVDLLRDKASADMSLFGDKVDNVYDSEKKTKKKTSKLKNLNLNGAALQYLEPDRVVELKIGDVCYGYYYVQLGSGDKESPFNSETSTMYAQSNKNPMNPSMNRPGSSRIGDVQTSPAAQNLNVTDEKLQLLSGVVLKVLGKKFNRKFIENNKEFKDLLYELLKQKYILQKGVNVTYFLPEEVIHFKTPSIFSKIVYFAKLYIAVLTNIVVIKLGRSHDKRIFYVNVGSDANHQQAIAKVVQDVKTKEFRMGSMKSVYTILSLNPAAFDDYYMPTINGERPVDIETIQGMDQDINNEFITFLRMSMIEGTGLPQAIIEANDNLEFARQISAQNANFCRRVIRHQKNFTDPFEQLIRQLYVYENKYSIDNVSNNLESINLNDIHIQFPSPGSLSLSNLVESFTQVDQTATYMAKAFVPDKVDQSSVDKQEAYKQWIVKKFMPQVDWDSLGELYKDFEISYQKEKVLSNITAKRKKDMEPSEEQDSMY